MIHLEVGERHEASVDAAKRWDSTCVEVKTGERYRLSAEGEWFDADIACGPEGYARACMRPFEWLRRMPKANWFALIGAVARVKRSRFVIGRGVEWSCERSGVLHAFANDVGFMYWNNRGAVRLTIERVK